MHAKVLKFKPPVQHSYWASISEALFRGRERMRDPTQARALTGPALKDSDPVCTAFEAWALFKHPGPFV